MIKRLKRLRTPLSEGTERSTLLWAVSASVLMILLGALDLLHANRPNDRALKTSLVAELLLIGEVRFTAPASASTPRQAPAPFGSPTGSFPRRRCRDYGGLRHDLWCCMWADSRRLS